MSSLPSEPQHERRKGERRKDERERIRQFEERIAGEQDERRRLALMLHDGAVQALAGIALMLDAVDHAIAESRNDDARRILATSSRSRSATRASSRLYARWPSGWGSTARSESTWTSRRPRRSRSGLR